MAEGSFGEWLKRQRKAGGWTQEQLAQLLSCSTITLRKIEAEERRPSAQIVERLAEIFKVPSTERTAFLRFTRGDWKAAPAAGIEDAPWRFSTGFPRSNLPVPPTALIGREQEIADLREYLSNPNTRLITLIGPPGIGKTRLSIEVARGALSQFAHGVFFVASAPLEDPNLIASTIGQTLGLRETQNQSSLERLKYGIGEKAVLIVLDNVEHLIEETATLVSDLLLACSNLKILTTSRESLRVPGEWLYPIPPLDVPEVSTSTDVETASQFAGLRLFVERARAVRADFTLSAENMQAVTSICAQLDGLPLAIELIAARIRLMSPQVLLSHFSDQFILYADGMRGVSARQKTLHNAMGWSYNLLPTKEQVLFRRLAVFAAGWTMEEAQAICSGEGLEADEILALLMHLVDKSLVIVQEQKGRMRYEMLGTIRQYAWAKMMELHEAEGVQDRHLNFFMNLAEEAEPKLLGAEQASWLDRLEDEQGNLRTALKWGLRNKAEAGLRLASALWLFWFMHAHFTEGRQWYEEALSVGKNASPLIRIRLLIGAASNAMGRSDFEQAARLSEQSLALSHKQEIEWGISMSLHHLGIAATVNGDYRRAQMLLEEGLVLTRETGDWAITSYLLQDLGFLAQSQNDYREANAFYEEVLALTREHEDRWGSSYHLQSLAIVANKQGDYGRAKALSEQAIKLAYELGDRRLVSGLLLILGTAALGQGKPERAARLLSAGEALMEDLGIELDPDERADFDRAVAMIRNQLGETTFENLQGEGRAMTIEQAIASALEDQD